MLSAALIELDGVLVDVASARAAALTAAFAAEGVAHGVAPASWLAPFDDLAHELASTQADETALALVALRAERDYDARVAAGVSLAPDAREAVQALGAEWRVGVVTMWRRADAERLLALAGLDASVRFVAAADDGPSLATPAARTARALARLRPPRPPSTSADAPASAVVVAVVASPAALAAARDAGARTVLVAPLAPGHPPRADVQLASLRGVTPARLSAALDCAPPRHPLNSPRR